jgi:uncharacterized phiE125 gp8 family phage protein
MTATRWDVKLVTGPTVEPILLDEAKLHLRVDATFDEDYLIDALISVAREYLEVVTGRVLVSQTFDEFLQDWPCSDYIELHRGPLAASPAVSINVKDSAGTETAWATSNYIVDGNVDPPRIVLAYGISWPSTTLLPASPIRIRYTAGYGAASSATPRPLYQALLLLIGHWFKFREAVLAGNMERLSQQLPLGFGHLILNYRMWA